MFCFFFFSFFFFHCTWPPIEPIWILGPTKFNELATVVCCINTTLECRYPTIALNCSYFVHLLSFMMRWICTGAHSIKWIIKPTYLNTVTNLVYCISTILWYSINYNYSELSIHVSVILPIPSPSKLKCDVNKTKKAWRTYFDCCMYLANNYVHAHCSLCHVLKMWLQL